jgi:hypothetical protein
LRERLSGIDMNECAHDFEEHSSNQRALHDTPASSGSAAIGDEVA